MGVALETLSTLRDGDDIQDRDELQIRAASERLCEQRGLMRALDYRAREVGIERVTSRADLLPLLFAHSTYKTYPESFIADGKWQLLSAWLDTLSTCDVTQVDVAGVRDLDEWIDRLSDAGITVVASSGTTGKHSFITLNEHDFEHIRATQIATFEVVPGAGHPNGRPFASLGPMSAPPLLEARRRILPVNADVLTYNRVRLAENFEFSRVRANMANGTATPNQMADMEARLRARTARLAADLDVLAEKIFARRAEPQTIVGMVGMFWRLLEWGKAAGIPDGSFHPDTLVVMNGGLKGLRVPDDYRKQFARFFGKISTPKIYGMTELSSAMPICEAGIYHVPPRIIALILDEAGERLVDPDPDGHVTGRFAAFNLLVEGHWGGVISGDKITANVSAKCACGRPGPVIEEQIVRYSELSVAGDDKLTCGGTMEQYIRGSLEPDWE